jgi:heme-degrading monooxygenase HmoA
MIANTPDPPYYAVIFTSIKINDEGYEKMSETMVRLAKEQEGFLGIESARTELGITVSYWTSLEAIRNWKADSRHQQAQKSGRDKWYKNYKVRVCKVERDYEF